MKKGNKIELDKYYTPDRVAYSCYDMAMRVIGIQNVSCILEPSAGAGAFIKPVRGLKQIIAIDIEPEGQGIIEADYLKTEIGYKPGRLVIGNPPFGRAMNLAQKFYKKAVTEGDYVAFILPISQYKNNRTMYEFDLVASIDLGKQKYSGRELHCCFNVYKRPECGGLNKKPSNKCKGIKIIRQDARGYEGAPYDVRMCYWGNGSAGKILKECEKYSGEYKIQIRDRERYREIKHVLETFDWNGYIEGIAMKRLKQWQIIEVLKREVEGFE